MLTVVALVIYLVNPDRLPGQGAERVSSTVGQVWSFGEVYAPAVSPQLTPDEVTVLERALIQPRGVESYGGMLSAVGAACGDGDGGAIARPVRSLVEDALRPDLDVLQILRC